ncbi:MAG: nucleotidyl transferase AbiEii/AbiGii toxin family protein [Bdellovibrionaceae bacterium]|nr:nucleotidyl transferase AbiEii/AbiGii toxin family protein [Pseudobdellovibrionaceae bacterium]
MDEVILSMLEEYQCKTKIEYQNALREIVQEIALLGLWRSKFYEYAAFYGGTALRILYGLNRFSEDLDFSLLKKNLRFNLEPHLKAIEEELNSFGFDIITNKKFKKNESQIKSAIIKGETITQFLNASVPTNIINQVQGNEQLKIKIEIDVNPPLNFDVNMKNLLKPIPFQVKTMTLESLFAGKLHAVLARKWKTRVKGRDFYDLLWYIGKGVQPNLKHLRERLIQSEDWPKNKNFTKDDLQKLLIIKINQINFDEAIKDVSPFLKAREQATLSLWNKEYFLTCVASSRF